MTHVLRALLGGALLALAMAMPGSAQEALSRLPRISDQSADPALKPMFDETRARGGQVLNLHLAEAHAPKLAKPRRDLGNAIRFETVLPPVLREMAVLRIASILESDYDRVLHTPLAKACGMTDAQIEAVPVWQGNDLFDATAQAMLAYVEAVILSGGEVDDDIFKELAKHFKPQEIVEISLIVAHHFANGIVSRALKVKLDAPPAAPAKC